MSPLDLAAEVLASGKPIRFRALGNSMRPVFPPGTMVTLAPAAGRRVRPGDVVLARGSSGLYIHRLISMDGGTMITRGDARAEADPAGVPGDILGVLVRAERGSFSLDLEWPVSRFVSILVSRLYRIRLWLKR